MTPAQIRLPAPESLTADFADSAYKIEMLVTRTGKLALPNDPGASPPAVDAPFTEQEAKNLRGMIAAWEADAKGAA